MSHTWKRCYWAEEKQLCRVPEVKAFQPRLLPGKAIGAALTLHRESSSSGRGRGHQDVSHREQKLCLDEM